MLKKIFIIGSAAWILIIILYLVDMLEVVTILDFHNTVDSSLFVIIWSVVGLVVLWPIYERIKNSE